MILKRKQFEELIRPINKTNTQLWVITKIKELPKPVVDIAIQLAKLDFINYVRITADMIEASSDNYPNRPKVPVVHSDFDKATGIQIIYDVNYKSIDFFDINSSQKGNGSKMVEAVFENLPKEWRPSIINDWSDGFWDKMIVKHKDWNWITSF